MRKLNHANKFVQAHKADTNPIFRNTFHPMPPCGWMNDPCGFVFCNGLYHLYYQHNPYAAKWGIMYWGHMQSSDLIQWHDLPVALAPDKPYENFLGCFTGSSLVIDDELHIFYTGVSFKGQQACHAVSEDGIRFLKAEKPVIPVSQRPTGVNMMSFRDPKVFFRDGHYYCLIGAGYQEKNIRGGQICLYKSEDRNNWQRLPSILTDATLGRGIFECPDIANIGGVDVVFTNMMYYRRADDERFQNLHSSVYLLGKFDGCTDTFTQYSADYEIIDYGTDFYAPQTAMTQDGRVIMIAWASGWKRTIPTAYLGHRWAGCMTLPRELSVRQGKLIQKPVRELSRYRNNPIRMENIEVAKNLRLEGVSGKTIELILQVDVSEGERFSVKLRAGANHGTMLSYDRKNGSVILDRSNSGESIAPLHKAEKDCSVRKCSLSLSDSMLHLHIILDTSIVEVFMQNGEKVMTATIYPPDDARNIVFDAVGKITIKRLEKYDIGCSPDSM